MDKSIIERVIEEAQETAERLNKLNSFMGSDKFIELDRVNQDLLYSQQRVMSEYVQILGQRLEKMQVTFKHR